MTLAGKEVVEVAVVAIQPGLATVVGVVVIVALLSPSLMRLLEYAAKLFDDHRSVFSIMVVAEGMVGIPDVWTARVRQGSDYHE